MGNKNGQGRRGASVEVVFELEQDDGWPPVNAEAVWSEVISDNLVQIDNVPWFVDDVSVGDWFTTCTGPDGRLRPVEKVRSSGNCTIRVLPSGDEPWPV